MGSHQQEMQRRVCVSRVQCSPREVYPGKRAHLEAGLGLLGQVLAPFPGIDLVSSHAKRKTSLPRSMAGGNKEGLGTASKLNHQLLDPTGDGGRGRWKAGCWVCGSRSSGDNFINCVTSQGNKAQWATQPIRQVVLLSKRGFTSASPISVTTLLCICHCSISPEQGQQAGAWSVLRTCISTVGALPLWDQMGARPLNWLLSHAADFRPSLSGGGDGRRELH